MTLEGRPFLVLVVEGVLLDFVAENIFMGFVNSSNVT